jgi:hypothetical protein
VDPLPWSEIIGIWPKEQIFSIFAVQLPKFPGSSLYFHNVSPNICSQTTSVTVTAVGWLTNFHTQQKETQIYGLECVPRKENTKFGVHILICRQAVMTKMLRGILQSPQTNIDLQHQIISNPLPSLSFPVYSSLIRETFVLYKPRF